MKLRTSFYSFETKQRYSVTVKNADCIDSGISSAKSYLSRKHNTDRNQMMNIDYAVVR